MTRRFAALALILLIALPAAATEHWLVLFTGYNQYGLGDVTDAATTYNGYTLEPGSMDDGTSWGAAVEFRISPAWSAGFGYERLPASTTATSGSNVATADVPLHLFKANGGWRPWYGEAWAVGLGLTLGVGDVGGTVEAESGFGAGLTGEPSGSCFLMEGMVSGEYRLVSALRLAATVGWRGATVDEVSLGNVPLARDDTGEAAALDYGGLFARVGFMLKLPTQSNGM